MVLPCPFSHPELIPQAGAELGEGPTVRSASPKESTVPCDGVRAHTLDRLFKSCSKPLRGANPIHTLFPQCTVFTSGRIHLL